MLIFNNNKNAKLKKEKKLFNLGRWSLPPKNYQTLNTWKQPFIPARRNLVQSTALVFYKQWEALPQRPPVIVFVGWASTSFFVIFLNAAIEFALLSIESELWLSIWLLYCQIWHWQDTSKVELYLHLRKKLKLFMNIVVISSDTVWNFHLSTPFLIFVFSLWRIFWCFCELCFVRPPFI